MSTEACSRRWRDAQRAKSAEEVNSQCRSCKIGAFHSGETPVEYSSFYGSIICPRCLIGNTRIIGGTRCVNCYNREREFIVGKNAKGTRPVKMKPLHRRRIRYAVADGRIVTYSQRYSLDTTELMIGVLRLTKGRVMFAFHGDSPARRQGRLF